MLRKVSIFGLQVVERAFADNNSEKGAQNVWPSSYRTLIYLIRNIGMDSDASVDLVLFLQGHIPLSLVESVVGTIFETAYNTEKGKVKVVHNTVKPKLYEEWAPLERGRMLCIYSRLRDIAQERIDLQPSLPPDERKEEGTIYNMMARSRTMDEALIQYKEMQGGSIQSVISYPRKLDKRHEHVLKKIYTVSPPLLYH